MSKRKLAWVAAAAALALAACAHTPKTESARAQLISQAHNTLQQMTARDPGLNDLLTNAAGYVVFPSVKSGSFVVGGAAGEGVLFSRGQVIGFTQLSQGSVGLQAGGQKYAELIILRDWAALDRLKSGAFDVGGQASAVAIRAGGAAETQFGQHGVAVFIQSQAGAEFKLSLSGQRIKYVM
jgi:lipid-binding SYLF domain-containing protein